MAATPHERPTRQRLRLRFRTTLGAMFLGLLVGVVGIVATSAYVNARFAVEDLSSQILAQTNARVGQHIDRALEVATAQSELNRALMTDGQLVAQGCDALIAYFHDAMKVHPRLSYLSFTYQRDGTYCHVMRTAAGELESRRIERLPDGQQTMTDHLFRADGRRVLLRDDFREPYEPRERPYYVAAQAAGRGTWTETYIFMGHSGGLDIPGVTRATPVLKPGGGLVGVLTADFDLVALSEFLRGLSVGQRGFAIVLERRRDGSRRIIAHPDPAVLTRPVDPADPARGRDGVPAGEVTDGRVRALMAQIPLLLPGAAATSLQFEHGDERYLGSCQPLDRPEPRWAICAVVPAADVMGRIERMNRTVLVVAAVGVLLALLVALWLSSRLASRLRRLADQTREIAEFRLDGAPMKRSMLVELDQLAAAVERMKVGLRGFRRYLPVRLVRLLHERQQEPELGGELREVTIYFSDISGFTTISEATEPMDMAARLGAYLAALSEEIRGTEGTVVQYVGDEIMAFWNAPLAVDDHPVKACRAALACQARGLALDADRTTPFHTRYGLHTTTVAVGHFGSPDRLYYGAIGDGVNLTSRLEGLNKHYGTDILVSETTYRRAGDAIVARPIDRVSVKGKREGIMVYELLSLAGAVDARTRQRADAYTAALEAYFERRWDEAIAGFEAALLLDAEDRPAAVMAGRARAYRDAPPPADWTGVHRMTTK